MQIQSIFSAGRRARLAPRFLAACATSLLLAAVLPASAATLERISESGRIKLGYMADAHPFTSRSATAAAEGYSVALCEQVVERVKTKLGRTDLAVEWVPVTFGNMVSSVKSGEVDLLCRPITPTLGRRADVAFSIPVFPGGVRAVLRNDAAAALRDTLAGEPAGRAVWRGSPAATVLGQKTFAVVSGTTTESWLAGRVSSFHIDSKVVPVADYRAALQALLDRDVDVVFGDRALLLGAMDTAAAANLTILPRLLTHEPLALALERGDDDFRLLVDSALSESYASPGFAELYSKWCGEYDDSTQAFFRWIAVAE